MPSETKLKPTKNYQKS